MDGDFHDIQVEALEQQLRSERKFLEEQAAEREVLTLGIFAFLLKIMIPWLNLTFSSLTPGGERGVLPTGGSVGGGVEEEREGGGQEGERFNHPRCEGKGSSLRETNLWPFLLQYFNIPAPTIPPIRCGLS